MQCPETSVYFFNREPRPCLPPFHSQRGHDGLRTTNKLTIAIYYPFFSGAAAAQTPATSTARDAAYLLSWTTRSASRSPSTILRHRPPVTRF